MKTNKTNENQDIHLHMMTREVNNHFWLQLNELHSMAQTNLYCHSVLLRIEKVKKASRNCDQDFGTEKYMYSDKLKIFQHTTVCQNHNVAKK